MYCPRIQDAQKLAESLQFVSAGANVQNYISRISILLISITLGAGALAQEEAPMHSDTTAVGGRGFAPEDVDKARTSLKKMEKQYREVKMETITAQWMKDLVRGLQEGRLSDKLAQVLISEESYTTEEALAAFGPPLDPKDPNSNLLGKLGDDDARMISKEYTLIRKQLRKETLERLIAQLRKSTDPRVQALANAVERAQYESLRSYDVAVHKIDNDPKQRTPICFTCGEDVALNNVDPGLHDPKEIAKGRTDTTGQDYHFDMAMYAAAKEAMVYARLDVAGDEPAFFNGAFGRTSDGRTVQLAFQDKDKHGNSMPLRPVALTAPGEDIEVSARRAEDPAFLNAARQHYIDETKANGGKWAPGYTPAQKNQIAAFMDKTNPGSPYMKQAEQTALAVAEARKKSKGDLDLRGGKAPVTKEVMNYLKSLVNEPPNADYYTPRQLAQTLGLMHPVTGEPLFVGRGPNSHAAPHYGVKVDWIAISNLKRTHPEEYKQIMERLNDVYNGSVYHYKIVNNHVSTVNGQQVVSADGYCLWCYLWNSPEAAGKMTKRQ